MGYYRIEEPRIVNATIWLGAGEFCEEGEFLLVKGLKLCISLIASPIRLAGLAGALLGLESGLWLQACSSEACGVYLPLPLKLVV
jgi:hypothetical protein